MSTNNFLPEGFELPKASGGNYFKPDEGTTKLRFLGKKIFGTVAWTEMHGTRKPIRYRLNEKVTMGEEAKTFFALEIWNYDQKKLQIWEITQRTIQEAILTYTNNPAWGDLTKYDIEVTKTGQKLETKYTITAVPPSDMPSEGAQASIEKDIDLEKLYTGEDPFADS